MEDGRSPPIGCGSACHPRRLGFIVDLPHLIRWARGTLVSLKGLEFRDAEETALEGGLRGRISSKRRSGGDGISLRPCG